MWAEQNRELPDGSALPGRFRFSVTPYLRAILDACADPKVKRVVCRKSAQIGWTDGVVNNLIGWRIDSNPGRIIVLFPREKSAIDFNDEKLEPMIESCPRLASKINLKSRSAGNRQLFKKYSGGFLKLLASNSPGDVKSTAASLVIIEEPDDCNQNVRGQGDSIKLAEERAKSYHDSLIVIGGTPTIKGASAIDEEMKKSDRNRWHVPCHHCSEAHVLSWENVRWDKDPDHPDPVYGKHQPNTAHYVCPACAGIWNDNERVRNMRRGRYVATAPFNGIAGFDELNELYSPFPNSTMPHVVKKFLEAWREFEAGKAEKLITFWNSALARSYEYTSDLPAVSELEGRAEPYAEYSVPAGGLALVMGIDLQHNRVAVTVWAFGRDLESWLVYWGEEFGAPADKGDPVWDALDGYLRRSFKHATGAEMLIEAVSIDTSDGQTSDAAYDWVRRHKQGRCKVMAVKGRVQGEIFATPPVRSIDPNASASKATRYGVKVHMVGTEKAKDLLLGFTADGGRIKRCDRAQDGKVRTGNGPGRMHWYQGVRADFFEQLGDSEVKIPGSHGRGKRVWTLKAGRRNEALDCTVYAEHAARALRLHLLNDSQWRARELQLRAPDLLSEQSADAAPVPVQRRSIDRVQTSAQKPPSPRPADSFARTEWEI